MPAASMESDKLPSHFLNHAFVPAQSNRRRRVPLLLLGMLFFIVIQVALTFHSQTPRTSTIPIHAPKMLQKCRHLHTKPSIPPDFNLRKQSDRYVPGTRATLLRNATIWTGGIKGFEIVEGDLLLDQGLIKAVGRIDANVLEVYKTDLVVTDLEGAWVTPGYARLAFHRRVCNSSSCHLGLSTFIHTWVLTPHLNWEDQVIRIQSRALHNHG